MGNVLCALALVMTVVVFFCKGIIAGLVFAVADWVVLGLIVKNIIGDRQGRIDAESGLPGGTSIFSLLTVIAGIAFIYCY